MRNQRDLHPNIRRIVSIEREPSHELFTAALSGLLAFAVGACGDGGTVDNVDFGDAAQIEGAKDAGTPTDSEETADAATEDATASPAEETDAQSNNAADAGSAEDGGSSWVDPATKLIGAAVPGVKTFAQLTTRCEDAGGYVQIHAACAGNNACAGFSYGDWGDGSQLQEHSCSGVNGCNGMSCVYTAAGESRTGKEVYNYEDFPAGAPGGCTGCHADYSEDAHGNSVVDTTKFKVYVLAGSTRTVANWLDVPATTQEVTVAFGKQTITDAGQPLANMQGYHRLLSRAEIKAVVQYIRTELTPIMKTIRVNDTP